MLLDFLFPNHTCLICKGELCAPQNNHMCEACVKNLPINTEPVTLVDAEARQYFRRVYSAFMYQGEIPSLVLRLKYNNNGDVAVALAPYMAATMLKNKANKNMVLVPVPLCKKRQKSRGYNQAELLAKEIGVILNLPVRTDILVRTKATTPQKKMSVKQREENLAGAFGISTEAIQGGALTGSNVTLVDDVFTSGSTVNECARVLREAGVKSVDVIVLARV